MSKYVVFMCRKCSHRLFCDADMSSEEMARTVAEKRCPDCGENGYLNWALQGVADRFLGMEEHDE